MSTYGRSTVVGVFRTREQARDAIDALKDVGFSSQDIGILMQDKDETREMAEDTGTSAGTGAATGAVGGGILGGLAGWLVGVGALAIPGVGPFIAAGALGTALAGAAIGAGIGAIAGALIGMGVPEEEAKWYEGEVRGGGTLVTVRSDTRHDEARRILKDHGAYDIQDRDAGTITSGTGMGTTGGYDTTRSEMTGTGRWDDVSSDYHTHWQQRHGSTGGRWEDYEPGYRYGYEMSRDPRYRGRSFNDVEYDLRKDWNTRHGDKPWDRFSSNVREGWEGFGDQGRGTIRGTKDRDRTIELREEQLKVDKERQKTGEVNLRKDVVSERQDINVPVTREEVDIERRKVNRPSDRPIGVGEDETINVPVYEEKVKTDKETVVSEEIDVQKRSIRDTEKVSDTVRREELRMDKEGDINVGSGMGTTGRGWDDMRSQFQSRWQQRYGNMGGRWEDYEPSYRYGYEMSSSPRYRGRSFSDVEPELRRDWETRHGDKPWDRFVDAIRDAWEGATRRDRAA